MTPAERDEVLRIAAGFFACEPKDALTMAGMIKLCNAVLRYVPPGEAASARLTDAMAVDRPAPTPTPAPGLDLDAVEAAHARMTAGEWYVHVLPTSPASGLLVFDVGPSDDHPVATTSGTDTESVDEAEANAAGIVALRNAAPALIAEVRALRAAAEEREADTARWRKVAPLIEAMREAAKVAHHDYATEDDATVDFRVTGHELIDAVTNLLAATKEPTP